VRGPARRPRTQLGGGQRVGGQHRVVERAHGGVPGGVGHLGHRHGGPLDERPGGLRAAGAREREGPCAELVVQQALELPGAVADRRRQRGHPAAVDEPVVDQPHRARDHVAAHVPCR
jgi:hypothetical protein